MKQIILLFLFIGTFLFMPALHAGRAVPQNSPQPKTQRLHQSPMPKWLQKAGQHLFEKKNILAPLDKNPNKYGLWSLIILGIGFLLSFIGIGYLFAPISIILGIIGLKKDQNNTLSILGIIGGSVGTLIGLSLLVLGILALLYGLPLLVQFFTQYGAFIVLIFMYFAYILGLI